MLPVAYLLVYSVMFLSDSLRPVPVLVQAEHVRPGRHVRAAFRHLPQTLHHQDGGEQRTQPAVQLALVSV